MGFTFHGDLLGISAAYRLSPQAAHKKLDRFYNLAFQHLHHACGSRANNKVMMFSDSLFFWGDDAQAALAALRELYVSLLSESLLLRGAIVDGCLSFEPRFTVDNFQKNLPADDTLARVTGLAGATKGARLIVERTLAHHLLPDVRWHTLEGYLQSWNLVPDVNRDDPRRFIAPIPEGVLYELLYFYPTQPRPLDHIPIYDQLKEVGASVTKELSEHYKETLGVIDRSHKRKR